METKSVVISDDLRKWIHEFQANMMKDQGQPVSFSSVIDLTSKLGALILSHPEEFTEKQKSIILEYSKEPEEYSPPYNRNTWGRKYLQLRVPAVIKKEIRTPHDFEMTKQSNQIYNEVLKSMQHFNNNKTDDV